MIELFSERYMIYQKIKYISSIILLSGLGLLKLVHADTLIVVSVICMIVIYLANEYIVRHDSKISSKLIVGFNYFELVLYNILDFLFPNNAIVVTFWAILIISCGIKFIIDSSEFEKSTIFSRKIMFVIPLGIKIVLSTSSSTESEWFLYVFAYTILAVIVFLIVDAYVHLNATFERIKRKLTIEKSNIESNNEKLLDYQEKVKTINEQINYQKIDLARTLRELEQVNIEIESQTEIMKYMASTFDVLKCMNVITDSIMEVKKPKLCALYVDENVYKNTQSSFIIKTNYSSMQRRLKKDVDTIFQVLSKDFEEGSRILKGDAIREYRFVGDANINSLAFLPLRDKKRMYGLMIVASDEDDFFDKGTSYYEGCVMDFNANIKSTKLYLQMEDMARKDGLTGIYNRVYNTELFKKVSKEAVLKNKTLTVALFDIDKFKSVNDTYGHLAGDEVIKMVARVAAKYAEKYNGFACRFGGEEFLLTLPDYDDKEALQILEVLHNEIKNTVVTCGGIDISVNVCIGVSSYPSLCDNPEMLVSRADKAMYYGKKHGRGRLVMDNPSIDED